MSDLFYGEFDTDITPPSASDPFPLPSATNVPDTTEVSITVSDTETGVALNSVKITIEGVVAYENGSQQNGYVVVVTGSSSSYEFVCTAPSPYALFTWIDVQVEAEDQAYPPNVMTPYTWNFQIEGDNDPPYVENEHPTAGSYTSDASTYIQFDVVDEYSGVVLSTLNTRLDGVTAVYAGVIQPGFTGTITALVNGWRVYLVPNAPLEPNVFHEVGVDAEDALAYRLDNYTWTFFIRPFGAARSFLFNTMARRVSASSTLQPRLSNVSPGSIGNIAMNVSCPVADRANLPAIGTSYMVKLREGGRLDSNLNAVRQFTKELGSGQITYETEQIAKGSPSVPKAFVGVNSNLFYVWYGIDRTMSKLLYSTACGAAYAVEHLRLCDRNEDSLLAIYRYAGGGSTMCVSIAKAGRIDSSPLTPTTLVSGFKAICGALIAPGLHLFVERDSTDKLKLNFCTRNDLGQVEFLDSWTDLTLRWTSNSQIFDVDMYSDGLGNAWMVAAYYADPTVSLLSSILLLRSSNGGRTWDYVYYPGTNTKAEVPNYATTEIGSLYWNLISPRLFWDALNNRWILTCKVHKDVMFMWGERTLTWYSDDFSIWHKLNYPILRQNVAGTTGNDLYGYGNARLVRIGSRYFAVDSDFYGQFMTEFAHENDIYSLRRAMFWVGDSSGLWSTLKLGSNAWAVDSCVFEDVLYLATAVQADGVTACGFQVHAYGTLSTLPDWTPYTNAYFGTSARPQEGHGWTETVTGSGASNVGDSGLGLTVPVGDTCWYERTDIVPAGWESSGFKFKFIVSTIGSNTLASGAAQTVHFRLPTTTTANSCDFTLTIASDGLRLRDTHAAWQDDYAHDLTVQHQIVVAYVPTSGTAGKVRVWIAPYGESVDTWTRAFDRSIVGWVEPTKFVRFGRESAPPIASAATWRAIYFCDHASNNDLMWSVNDGMPMYTDPFSVLDPMPLTIADVRAIGNNITLSWRGLDGAELDYWTFEVTSDFHPTNILRKCPNLQWRSDDGPARGISSSDTSLVMNAGSDGLGAFVFDTVVLLNTNFRKCTFQANDTDSWGTPAFEQELDLEIDRGTLTSAPGTRINADMMVLHDSTKSWIAGSLVGKYVILEYLQKTGPTTYYKNVAFKVVENGTDSLVISTKGLNVLGNVYTSSGIAYVIYDTRIVADLGSTYQYRYVRLFIPQAALYSTAWNVGCQPNLPNEGSWCIGELDFGRRIELLDEPDYGYGETEDPNIEVQTDEDGSKYITRTGRPFKTFRLRWGLLEDPDHQQLDTLHNAIHEADEPFWYIPDIDRLPHDVYLVTTASDLLSERFLPENQRDELTLEEVT